MIYAGWLMRHNTCVCVCLCVCMHVMHACGVFVVCMHGSRYTLELNWLRSLTACVRVFLCVGLMYTGWLMCQNTFACPRIRRHSIVRSLPTRWMTLAEEEGNHARGILGRTRPRGLDGLRNDDISLFSRPLLVFTHWTCHVQKAYTFVFFSVAYTMS